MVERKKRIIENIRITELASTGQGKGQFEDKTVLAWNALPGESVDLEISKRKRGVWEGAAHVVRDPSPLRREPVENHYLSCSPLRVSTAISGVFSCSAFALRSSNALLLCI